MWRPWGKSTVKIRETYSPTIRNAAASSSPTFSCSSFKDIQLLCSDDPSPLSSYSSSSPKNASRIFHRVRVANSVLRSWPIQPKLESEFPCVKSEPDSVRSEAEPDAAVRSKVEPDPPISIPGRDKSIVVYFTSLRVVRSTFEDCKTVRSILQSFRVQIDERDLSMDASFAAELHRIFGGDQAKLKLPRVFIGSKYIGGAEEVRQLHESGELKKMVQNLPTVEPGDCQACGGHGFIPCNDCYGSHKLYKEKLGFRSCTACNENGLIRCPSCSFPPLDC